MLYYIIGILLFFLIVAVYYCIKFAMIVLKVQDILEESLDLLDQKYNNISQVLEIPIFYDSSEVKRVVREIEDTKNIVLYIASSLTESIQEKAIVEDAEDIHTKEDE
jgi:hypothetical protein